MKKWLSILPLSLILLLCACQSSDASAQIFAMDTVMDLTVQGSGAAQALKDLSLIHICAGFGENGY